MTFDEAKSLKIGDIVWNNFDLNKNGKPGKWKVCCEDAPFRGQKEEDRTYPYRVMVLLKRRFGEYEWICELEVDKYSLEKIE